MATRTRRKAIEGDPQALPRLVSAREVKKVKANIREHYGDDLSDRYCADLIAFVDTVKEALADADARREAEQADGQ